MAFKKSEFHDEYFYISHVCSNGIELVFNHGSIFVIKKDDAGEIVKNMRFNVEDLEKFMAKFKGKGRPRPE